MRWRLEQIDAIRMAWRRDIPVYFPSSPLTNLLHKCHSTTMDFRQWFQVYPTYIGDHGNTRLYLCLRNRGRLESPEITSMFRPLSHAHTPFRLFQISQMKMKGNYASKFFEMVACTVVFAIAEGNLEVLRYSSIMCWDRRVACHENPLTLSSSDVNLREAWTKRGRAMRLCWEYEKEKRFHPKQWWCGVVDGSEDNFEFNSKWVLSIWSRNHLAYLTRILRLSLGISHIFFIPINSTSHKSPTRRNLRYSNQWANRKSNLLLPLSVVVLRYCSFP